MDPQGEAELPVTPEAKGSRVDIFVGRALHLSRARLKRLFEQGAVRIDGRHAKKGDRVETGQKVRVRLGSTDRSVTPDPEAPLSVLHVDASLVFLDKPAGIATHPLDSGELGTDFAAAGQ